MLVMNPSVSQAHRIVPEAAGCYAICDANRAVVVIARHREEGNIPPARLQKVQPEGTEPTNFWTPGGGESCRAMAMGLRVRPRSDVSRCSSER